MRARRQPAGIAVLQRLTDLPVLFNCTPCPQLPRTLERTEGPAALGAAAPVRAAAAGAAWHRRMLRKAAPKAPKGGHRRSLLQITGGGILDFIGNLLGFGGDTSAGNPNTAPAALGTPATHTRRAHCHLQVPPHLIPPTQLPRPRPRPLRRPRLTRLRRPPLRRPRPQTLRRPRPQRPPLPPQRRPTKAALARPAPQAPPTPQLRPQPPPSSLRQPRKTSRPSQVTTATTAPK